MADTNKAAAAPTPAEAPARRPYVAPELRRLGSVRELTLGPTNFGKPDTTTGRRGGAGSSRDFKDDIQYLTAVERQKLADDVLGLRLASYLYKPEMGETPGRHVGFIIEDAPEAPFVAGKHVDLYSFCSALAATVQEQAARIQKLEAQLDELRSGRGKA